MVGVHIRAGFTVKCFFCRTLQGLGPAFWIPIVTHMSEMATMCEGGVVLATVCFTAVETTRTSRAFWELG